MREYIVSGLFGLTQAELKRVDYEMVIAIAELPEHSEERSIAYLNQHRIRRELARRDISPH